MLLNDKDLRCIVDKCVLKMATAKQQTFWQSFAEIMFRCTRGFSTNAVQVITDASHLRLEEFEKAWDVNLYNRRILK